MIAGFREAAMEWAVTFEGSDAYGEIGRTQVRIEKDPDALSGVVDPPHSIYLRNFPYKQLAYG